jgi:hypothetical protein
MFLLVLALSLSSPYTPGLFQPFMWPQYSPQYCLPSWYRRPKSPFWSSSQSSLPLVWMFLTSIFILCHTLPPWTVTKWSFKNTNLAWSQWLTLIILATWETETRSIMVQSQPGQIVQETPTSKITRPKWTGGVAQVVEQLLCKWEALSITYCQTFPWSLG